MSALKQTGAQAALNYLLRPGNQPTPTMPIKIRQMSTTPTEVSAGVELSGSGFTSGGVAITFNAPVVSTGTYSATCSNQALTITNSPAGTVNGILLVDSSGTPLQIAWGALNTPRTLVAGDTLSYPAGAIVVSI